MPKTQPNIVLIMHLFLGISGMLIHLVHILCVYADSCKIYIALNCKEFCNFVEGN